ncbi:zinc finger protein 431-like isoform X2 [Wyeomyia smithii]|uniref:zinc finger protein 431-like isoform X2 n=1 Tax=Wyeomyia smithii TaxID=174621 RepID=UPI002467D782|nr:zinc finger protein 431-like isoform X2 [Wyeomyia smithii]
MSQDQYLCRICSFSTKPVFSLNEVISGCSLIDMLRQCVNIEIDENDGLPYQCCTDCKSDLIVAYKMVTRCYESNTKLREQLMQISCEAGSALEVFLKPYIGENEIKTEVADDEMIGDECIYAEPLVDFQPSTDAVKEESSTNNNEHPLDIIPDKEDRDEASTEKVKPKRKKVKIEPSIPKRCCRCKQKLNSVEEMQQHSKNVHLSMKIFEPAKINARPHECNVCYKRYTTKKALSLHKQQLYIENQYKCDQCVEEFRSESSLNAHKESHVLDVVQPYSNRKGQQPRCCACYEQFNTDEQLKQHARDVHLPESTTATEDTNNLYKCDLCHRRYKNLRILREHQLKPYRTQQYQCSTCGRIFRDKNAIADHERSHQDERAYVCPICAKSFVMKDSYRKHVRAHSLADDRFKCDICNKGFKTKANLKGHYITHNPHIRPLQCNLCPATFARKVCLQAHIMLHTGEKPYKCDQCDAAYTFSTDLKRHIMAHQGLKPHVCTICGRGYPRKDYLRKHMANHSMQQGG